MYYLMIQIGIAGFFVGWLAHALTVAASVAVHRRRKPARAEG